MILNDCVVQFACAVCMSMQVCVCVCRELVELSLIPMQAIQAPEACISNAHQRNCVKAFIVIIDGQMPNWKNSLNVFPFLFISPSWRLCGITSRKKCQQISGQAHQNHQLPFSLTTPSLMFCLLLICGALFAIKSFKLDLSMQAVYHDCLFPPLTCANGLSISGLPQHV